MCAALLASVVRQSNLATGLRSALVRMRISLPRKWERPARTCVLSYLSHYYDILPQRVLFSMDVSIEIMTEYTVDVSFTFESFRRCSYSERLRVTCSRARRQITHLFGSGIRTGDLWFIRPTLETARLPASSLNTLGQHCGVYW